MKKFLIAGDIVAKDSDKQSYEDVCPTQVEMFLKNLADGEAAELQFNSLGGDVFAGLAICNMIRQASKDGHAITANVISIAASIASVIACACDRIKIADNAFLMLHLPWCQTAGNAIDLRKDIESLERCKAAIIAIYKTKFNMAEKEIEQMLIDETWIVGSQARETFRLDCEVIPTSGELKIAARLQDKGFTKIPKELIAMDEKTQDENAVVETTEQAETQEAVAVEQQPETETAEETIPKAEAEKRVIGMQSAMGKQIEAMKKQHAAEIENLKIELKTQNEELAKAKAEAISLATRLADAQRELQETASALESKTQALCTLNANVLTPSEDLPTLAAGLAKCKTPQEKVDFIRGGNYIH